MITKQRIGTILINKSLLIEHKSFLFINLLSKMKVNHPVRSDGSVVNQESKKSLFTSLGRHMH